jgi:AcrR family transcriptional regulator
MGRPVRRADNQDMAALPPQEGTASSASAELPNRPATREPGLRERKKARTRALIREEALRLFAEQGFDQTTVEQIAAAAEVSPSTFFRYFPSKEAVILIDDYQPVLVDALKALPDGVPAAVAVREAVREAFAQLTPTDLEVMRQRALLVGSVLELRAAWLANTARAGETMAGLLAQRTGKAADDPSIRLFVAALGGIWIEVMRYWSRDPGRDLAADMDEAIRYLESGLPL